MSSRLSLLNKSEQQTTNTTASVRAETWLLIDCSSWLDSVDFTTKRGVMARRFVTHTRGVVAWSPMPPISTPAMQREKRRVAEIQAQL